MLLVKGPDPIKCQAIVLKSVDDASTRSPVYPSCKARHICLLSAFISQRASDSFGKLKAHVYFCWGASHYRAIYRPSAAQSTLRWRARPNAKELVGALRAAWFDDFAPTFGKGNDTPFRLQWALLSLPSLSHNQCFSSFSQGAWEPKSQCVWEGVTAGNEWETRGLFISGTKQHLYNNSRSLAHKVKSTCSGMDLGDGNTFSTLGFSPSPNLISSGFSNNTESECTWTYLTWVHAKPHSQVEVKIHQTWRFVCWIFSVFLLFFLSAFSCILPKFTAGDGHGRVNVGALHESVKGAQPVGPALLGAFLQSRTRTTGKSSQAPLPRNPEKQRKLQLC